MTQHSQQINGQAVELSLLQSLHPDAAQHWREERRAIRSEFRHVVATRCQTEFALFLALRAERDARGSRDALERTPFPPFNFKLWRRVFLLIQKLKKKKKLKLPLYEK